MAEAATWYLYDGKEKSGPFTPAQAVAQAMRVPTGRKSLVWSQGMTAWSPLDQIPALAQVSPAPSSAAATAPAPKPWRPQDKTGDHSMMIEVAKLARSHANETTGMLEGPTVLKAAEEEARSAARAERRAAAQRGSFKRLWILLAFLAAMMAAAFFMYGTARAETPPAPTTTTAPAAPGSEKLNVDKFKEKFWAKGEESELRVVQNRLYSKQRKFQIGILGGSVSTDPFLSVYNYGGTVGFHITEYFGINAVGWAYAAGSSSALTTLQNDRGITANTNKPKNFFGGELTFSPIYGKLSLLGKAIIYLDTHIMLGGGSLGTETGRYLSPIIGIGEQVFLNRFLSLSLEYRFLYTSEMLMQNDPTSANFGTTFGPRGNSSSVITLGAAFMFGFF